MGRSTSGVRHGSIRPLLLTGALLLGLIASPNVASAGTARNAEPLQLADNAENIGAAQSSVFPTCVTSPEQAPETGQFVGTVTDGDKGVAGAYVYLIPLSEQERGFEYEACVITGSDGNYTLQSALESHPYIVVVDPPIVASHLSSGMIRAQSPDAVTNMSLALISLNSASTISGTVEFGGMSFAETLDTDGMRWVLVCAYSTSNDEFLGCGTVRDRGVPHGYSFEIGTPAGVVPTDATIFAWEWPESGGASFTAQQASDFSDLNNILIDLWSGPDGENPGEGGDWNGCASDQSPTVTGTVTAGANPYADTKVELFLRQSILPPVPGWAIEATDYRSVTDSEGNFGFCLDLTPQNRPDLFGEERPDVVVVAESKDRGPAAIYGDSASGFVTLGADGSLPVGANFDIAMAAPTFRGQVGDAGRIEVHYAIVDFGFVQRNGRASMDDQGRFATAMPISSSETDLSKYRVEAYPHFTEEVPALAPMIWALADLRVDSTEAFALDAALPSATLRVDLRPPDNTEFGPFDHLSSVSLERTGGDCEDNNQAIRYLEGCRVPVAMSRTGLGARPETPGEYQLVIGAHVDGRDLPPSTFMLAVDSDGVLLVPDGWGLGSDGIWVAQLADAAITFRPVTPGGQPVSGATQFQVERMTVDTGRVEFRNVDEVRPDDYEEPNSWGWTPTQAGLYRVRLAPPSGRLDLAYTVFYFRVNGTGSDARMNGICTEPTGPSDTPSCSDITPTSTPDVIFASPNLTFKVCAGDTGPNCQSVGSETQFGTLPDLEVRRLLRDGEGRVTDNLTLYRSPVIHEGTALRLTEPTDGITMFEVSVIPPFQNPGLLAPLNMTFLIVSSSATPGDNGWYQCAARDDCRPETGTKLTVTKGVINLGEIVMQQSRVVVQVRRPGGTNLGTRSWVQVSRERPCDYDDSFICPVYVGAQETRLDGVVGFELEAGVYEIVAEPPRNDTSGVSSGQMHIEVGTEGTVVAATVSGVPQQRAGSVDEPLWLDLRTSNVTATVRAGDSVRSFAQVGVERWNGQHYEWTNIWGFSDRNGVVRLRLEEGQWRLRAQPSPMDAGIFTEARLVLVISAAGEITSVEGLEYEGTPLILIYGVPNLAGEVLDSNGDPVPYAGVGLEAWNGQWFEGFTYTNTWADGRFALSVGLESEPQTYRLGIDPPAVISGGVRTIRHLWFPADSDSDKSPCVISREVAEAAPVTRPASCGSPAVITLDGPNLQGRVIGTSSSGTAPQAAWVYPRRWNGEWFDWVDQWSDARAGIGNFGFILTPGFYEISAEPRPGSGFAKTSIHVNVLEGGALQLCGLTVQSGYEMPDFGSCRSVGASDLIDGRLVIELIGANLRAAVTYTTLVDGQSATVPLREGWVEIFDTTDGQSRWVSSVGLSRTGEFALRLDPRSSTEATKFQVVVSPSNWNSQISDLNLGKTRLTLWAQTVGGATRLCANDPALGACQVIEPGIRSVEMSAGNVRGTALTPVGSTPVPDAQISVERWVSTGGSGYWEWANEWTNTGSTGGFALSLEEDHHYRLTVRAPWGRADVSPTSVVIRVELGGVCVVAETVTTCDGNFASGPLTVTMGEPNLRGKILIPVEGGGFTAQPNVWVSVERWTGSWWEWTGNSTNASVTGDFGLTVSDGVYRVTVDAPWGTSASDLTRFSVGVTVSANTVQWASGAAIVDGRAQLVYPTANAVFTVLETSAGGTTPVRDAWVSVERKVDGQWRWVEINGASRSNGRVALRLPEPAVGVTDEYRLTINPPWNRGNLPRFTTTVTVTSAGVVPSNGWDLVFPSANVSGQILAVSPGEGVQSVPNRWGWIEVRNANGAWLEGTSSNINGQFSLYLPNPAGEGATTSYTLVAYPNPSLLSAPPIRMHVTVSGATPTLVGCEYATGGSCLTEDGRIAAAFDFIAPNLTVSVMHEGQMVQGAFVIISRGDTRIDLVTDAAGQVKVNLEPGEYSVTVVSTRVGLAGTGTVSVPEAGMANLQIDLTPAGESG